MRRPGQSKQHGRMGRRQEATIRERRNVIQAERRWRRWLEAFGNYGDPCTLGRKLIGNTLLGRAL